MRTLTQTSWRRRSLDPLVKAKSQLRIKIECAFGMFTHQWAILRRAIPSSIRIVKTVALVNALAKLHSFCIGERDLDVPDIPDRDEQGGVALRRLRGTEEGGVVPVGQIDGGRHFVDIARDGRRSRERQYQARALPERSSCCPEIACIAWSVKPA